jgi:hypothetical protein
MAESRRGNGHSTEEIRWQERTKEKTEEDQSPLYPFTPVVTNPSQEENSLPMNSS